MCGCCSLCVRKILREFGCSSTWTQDMLLSSLLSFCLLLITLCIYCCPHSLCFLDFGDEWWLQLCWISGKGKWKLEGSFDKDEEVKTFDYIREVIRPAIWAWGVWKLAEAPCESTHIRFFKFIYFYFEESIQ